MRLKKILVVMTVLILASACGCAEKTNEATNEESFVFITDSVNSDSDKVKTAKSAFDEKTDFNNIAYKFTAAKSTESVSGIIASQSVQSSDFILMFSGVISEYFVNEMKGKYANTAVVIDEYNVYDNAATVYFNMNEPAFLAGILAAKTTKTGHIGYIGYEKGADIEAEVGFMAGVKTILPAGIVDITYVGSYNNVEEGYICAYNLISDKVDVLYTNCGASTIGINECASEYGASLICAGTYRLENTENCLAQITKNYKNAVSHVIDECLNGNFQQGQRYGYGFSEEFADIILSEKVSSDITQEIEVYKEKIMWKTQFVPYTYEEYNNIYVSVEPDGASEGDEPKENKDDSQQEGE